MNMWIAQHDAPLHTRTQMEPTQPDHTPEPLCVRTSLCLVPVGAFTFTNMKFPTDREFGPLSNKMADWSRLITNCVSAASRQIAMCVQPDDSYVDDSSLENGHACLREKIAADRPGWVAMNSKCVQLAEGSTISLAMITDQDKASRNGDGCWVAMLAFYTLTWSSGAYTIAEEHETRVTTSRGDKSGRGAEYSALELFEGKLLIFDDRSGNVDEIVRADATDTLPYKVAPLVNSDGEDVVLRTGDGTGSKGLKCEWATQKDGQLFVGSTGKPRTDDASVVLHHGELWIKSIDRATWAVTHHDAVRAYNTLCAAAMVPVAPAVGEKSSGFMVHEAARWSDVHQKWFFAVRPESQAGIPRDRPYAACLGS